MGCIYRWYNTINGKSYIGQYRKNVPTARTNRHIRDAQKGSTCALHQAIMKYGIEAFEISVLCVCETQDEVDRKEDEYITEYKSMISENGYNMVRGGKGRAPNFHHKEEHKQKMSEMMKGKPKSEQTKERLRNAKKNKPASEKNKEGIALAAQKKFNDQIFPKRLAEWVQEYTKKGSIPDPNSSEKNERKAGLWRIDMLRKLENSRSKSGLTEGQIKQLNETSGWKWRKDEDEFLMQLEKYKEVVQKYPNQTLRDKDDTKPSFNWQNRMRELYKKKDPYLTEERIYLLNSLEGWSWNSLFVSSFYKSFEDWKEFVIRHKRLPSMSCQSDTIEKKLARWQSKTRIDYSKKEIRLTNEKINLLNSHTMWKWDDK